METTEETVSALSVGSFLEERKPSIPVYTLRPHTLQKVSTWFLKHFSGDVLYSVKSNPDVSVLKYLHKAGVKHFDVASLKEIKLIHNLFPDSKMYFMHPMKSEEAIHEAYFNYGIKAFSLDSIDELVKILTVTNNADDLSLHVRLAIPNAKATFNLSSKFGVDPNSTDAEYLVKETRRVAKEFGICFHVGSQCLDKEEYVRAINITKDLVLRTEVELDVLDIGGGFPASYPGMTPDCLKDYIKLITSETLYLKAALKKSFKVWCEPGRALVADSGSLVVKVEGRKGDKLYINDGIYGGLFDAGFPNFIYPTKVHRLDKKNSKKLDEELFEGFSFYGPTCDSLDVMKGPFLLPDNIAAGDYIEIGQLGAYSKSIRTSFNGFDDCLQIEVNDKPLLETPLE